MNSPFEQVLEFIAQPVVGMVYHLVVSIILISVISPGLGFSLSELSTKSKRVLIGITILIASRLLLFIASGLIILGFEQIETALPVLDRVVNTFNLVIIIWLWVFDEPNRRGDIGAIIAGAVTLFAGVGFTTFWVYNGEPNTLNSSNIAMFWSIFTTLILLGGEWLLFKSESKERNQSLIMLMIILFGELGQLISQDPTSDYPNIARLTYIAAFSLLLGLARRFQPATPPEPIFTPPIATPIGPPPSLETLIQDTPASKVEDKEDGFKKGIDLKLFLATMALASVTDPKEICQLLTMYASHALVADISLLLSVPDEQDHLHLICGYDLIVEESLSSTSFDHRLIPGYLNAIQDKKPVQISSKDKEKLFPFADRLNLDELGNFLAYPIPNRDGQILASLVLITPYSKYNWTDEDLKYLSECAPALGDVLQRAWGSPQSSGMTSQFAETMQALEIEKKRLLEENEVLAAELAVLAVQVDQPAQHSEELETAKTNLENASAAIKVLEEENTELKAQLENLAKSNLELSSHAGQGDVERVEQDLERALEQVSHLQTELSQANRKLNQMVDIQDTGSNGDTISDEQAEVIASIAQELRQPMSSISGYTDLLISESVGILGALQKKFLERVKASTDRMNRLIGDLIQITTLESGSLEISLQAFNLVEVIDLAIEMTSTQFREKNIILRVDLPLDLPNVQSDKDALQQIITHLLQNAGSATPNEGEIFLKAELSPNSDDEVILIEVSDSGEGIPKEDLPRVFSRLYRADNPLIQGVGDTGVGLSIAKTLTEALGGRIWVESELEIGSTFSVLLPVASLTTESQGG